MTLSPPMIAVSIRLCIEKAVNWRAAAACQNEMHSPGKCRQQLPEVRSSGDANERGSAQSNGAVPTCAGWKPSPS